MNASAQTWPDLKIAKAFLANIANCNNEFLSSLSPGQRDAWARMTADAINSQIGTDDAANNDDIHSAELRQKGISILPPILSPEKLSESVSFLLSKPVYNTHVYEKKNPSWGQADHIPRMVGSGAEQHRFGSYAFEDLIMMPHLMDFVTHPSIVNAARSHLGTQPTVYSINAWWSFPGHRLAHSNGQEFHRDKDFSRFCTAFMYLTDVDRASGPHQYLEYSHDISASEKVVSGKIPGLTAKDLFHFPRNNYGNDKLYLELWQDHLREIVGPAGTSFIANTYGLHRGLLPTLRPRLVMWVRYAAFVDLPEHTRVPREALGDAYPTDDKLRYMLRCIVSE